MSKNVMYILIGLAIVLVVCFYLQSLVVSSLKPPDADELVIPDTHQKVQKPVKGVR